MPKVYEVESGRPRSKFIVYPNWKCPRCRAWRREPMKKVCKSCSDKELFGALNHLEDGL